MDKILYMYKPFLLCSVFARSAAEVGVIKHSELLLSYSSHTAVRTLVPLRLCSFSLSSSEEFVIPFRFLVAPLLSQSPSPTVSAS